MLSIASKARPYLGAVVLTTALLVGGGIYSAMRMPSSVYPEVTFPRIAVVAKVPDRDVTNMELKVTRPLEEAVTGVVGVSQVRSKTIRGGSELSIDFNPETDMRLALEQTSQRANAARSDMPPNISLTIEQMTPSVFPILSLVLTGGDSPAQLRDYAYYELAPLIKKIPDVKFAEVGGGDVREFEVICRPEDLLAHGLSAADLADQIGQLTPLQPVGRVENQPLAFQLLVNAQVSKVRQIEELVISTSSSKTQPVRVKDVADVKILHQDRTQSIGYDQKDAVVITVFRRLGGNTLQVSRNVAKLLEEKGLTLPAGAANKPPPHNIQATIVYDQARFVETAVDNVRDAIIVGGLFSVLILLAFLRSWRATLVAALAIPVTLAITFLFLHWTGETLNLMSLGGLAVAIGLIIDDAVVVIENIARHLTPHGHGAANTPPIQVTNGETHSAIPSSTSRSPQPMDPVDAASGEITGAVIGSTLTTVLVFVPLAFIAGVYGQFFASLSWSLSIAVLVSMVISLTLVPVFAAKFLAGRPMPAPGPIYRFVANVYEVVLAVALRFPVDDAGRLGRWPCCLSACCCTPAFPNPSAEREEGKPPPPPLVKGLKTGLMPAMDEGACVVDYFAPAGSPLAETERKAKKIEEVLSKHPDVKAYVRRTGAEMGLFATQTSRGDFQVVLRPAEDDPYQPAPKARVRPNAGGSGEELKSQGKTVEGEKENIRKQYRRRPLRAVMDEVEDGIKDMFGESQLKIETVQIMADELNDLSGANKPVEVKLFGPDQRQLRKLAAEVAETLEKKGKGRGIKQVNSNVREGNPDLMIRLDGVLADKVGMKPDTVARQLKAIFQGQIATQMPESSLRITDVRVRYPDSIRFGTDLTDPTKGFFDRQRVLNQLILLPDTKLPTQPAAGPAANASLSGPVRAVPLYALGDIKAVRTPDEQYRENQQPAIFVTAELRGRGRPEQRGRGRP